MDPIKKLAVFALILIMTALPLACGRDNPPDPGTPEPEKLNGTFESEYGTLTFNGDGRSISFDLADDFAEAIGLPQSSGEGTYVFIFGHGEWRYDAAETFRIMVGDKTASMRNIVGVTSSDRIGIASPWDAGQDITFLKKIGSAEQTIGGNND